MDPKNNIVQELQELNSQLAGSAAQTPYQVPQGYFDGLMEQVMRRIKELEAANAADELAHLSPVLSQVSKQMPYTVPAGYFESIEERTSATIAAEFSASEELESISPLLSGLKKTNPYSIPDGYFDTVMVPEVTKPAAKVVSMGSRKWFRLAAAAVVTGAIILAGVLLINNQKVTPTTDSYAWVKKNTKKVTTEKIEEFIQLTDEEKFVKESVASNDVKPLEVKDLVKDIPEEEIQSLLSDTKVLDEFDEVADETATDETLLN